MNEVWVPVWEVNNYQVHTQNNGIHLDSLIMRKNRFFRKALFFAK